MDKSILESGIGAKCMVMEKYNGLMGENIRVNIETTKKKDKVHFIGQMAENILVNIKKIKSMELVNIFGMMVEYFKDNG